LEIQIAEGQNLEKALRQFRRKVQRAGILSSLLLSAGAERFCPSGPETIHLCRNLTAPVPRGPALVSPARVDPK